MQHDNISMSEFDHFGADCQNKVCSVNVPCTVFSFSRALIHCCYCCYTCTGHTATNSLTVSGFDGKVKDFGIVRLNTGERKMMMRSAEDKSIYVVDFIC